MRRLLIAALVSCADGSVRAESRRFLHGLSRDELQFIAAYLGSRILDGMDRPWLSGIRSEDRELKLILLREYLSLSGLENRAAAFN